ncbi:hypothetical protein [Psychrosphaera algicola]|uniref:Uncharacterized protein n=1 Tax=Psychrosphaera algicola TaxID=3023714 RepID=A0ABT5FCZ8_9GAMM|nr:hypothetical protein [Psychrosphaera sp. G1-22]MDC2888924.1 hypothetical protein [Psychrosphaera sp. G1-22]
MASTNELHDITLPWGSSGKGYALSQLHLQDSVTTLQYKESLALIRCHI